MKRLILFFLVSLSCVVLSQTDTVQEFEELKSDIINELSAVEQSYSYVVTQMSRIYENGLQEYNNIVSYHSSAQTPETQGMVAGAQQMMVYFNDYQYLRNDMQGNISSVANAISMINRLTYPTNSTVDLQPVLDAIASNTYHISTAVYSGSEMITNSIAQNVDLMLARADISISNLVVIADILRSFDFSGGGSSGGSSGGTDLSDLYDYLDDIISILDDVRNLTLVQNDYIGQFVDWALDINGVYQKYFRLTNSRLELPDTSLSADLALMWQYAYEEMTNIVLSPNSFTLTAQVFPVVSDLGANGVRLSNEGVISLQNLAFNQRQYLCSIEMLNQLKGLNSTNNLSWITNYLATVQRPYYDMYNFMLRSTSPRFMPYNDSPIGSYSDYTNFLLVASSGSNIGLTRTAFHRFRSQSTNYFERLELYLMTLNGLFPLGNNDVSEFEDVVSDDENNDRMIRYATNALNQVSEELATTTNAYNVTASKIQGLITAFNPALNQPSDGIRVTPTFDIGGIQFQHIDITYSSIESFADPCRLILSCVWWVMAVFFALSFFFRFLEKCGRLVYRVQTLLEQFLSS